MLKADLHIHVKGDPKDPWLDYDIYDLINDAKKKNFNVLGITNHNKLFTDKKAIIYASKLGILLIPGIEKNIEGKHVLIYNCNKYIEKIHSFKQLNDFKKKNPKILIIAPHPYFFSKICLKDKIIKYLDLFDAWEFSFFHTNFFNPNAKLKRIQKKYKKSLIGNSDVHNLTDLGLTYSLINSNQDAKSIILAIKKGNLEIVSKKLNINQFLSIIFRMCFKK